MRSVDTHLNLFKEYYQNTIGEEDTKNIKELVARSLSEISDKDTDLRNVKWSINKLKFDRTFSYGNENLINFDSMPGITGIFGQNARGKSSIIGTIAYTLFNTSDRGSIKNIHIVNTRHTSCKSELDISINNVPYRIIRDTKKKQAKNGVWAPTNLKLFKLDKQGNISEDLTEEQRRETEKIIRGMIGDADAFMMTSLASQGQMNTFIKEKATARKNILSNFLDLSVFDKMNEYAKNESSTLKSKINTFEKIDWQKEISLKEKNIVGIDEKLKNLEVFIDKRKADYESLIKELHSTEKVDVTKREVEKAKKEYSDLNRLYNYAKSQLSKLNEEIFEDDQKIKKIEVFLESFNLEEIKDKIDAQQKI